MAFGFFVIFCLLLAESCGAYDSERNFIGKICFADRDCSVNEYCKIPKLFQPHCNRGYCKCKPCFANKTESSSCEQVYIERPCDLACNNATNPYGNCDDWCEDGQPLRRLALYSDCQHFYQGKRSRRVLCQACYKSMNRQCVPEIEIDNEKPCEEDCSCRTNLKCNGRCMCLTTNEHWDPVKMRCVRRELGDKCLIDRDCDIDPKDSKFGHLYRGLACHDGKCSCAKNFSATKVTIIDDSNRVITIDLCIINGAKTGLTEREKCHFENIYDIKFRRTKLCEPGLLCMACGEHNPTKICRKSLIEPIKVSHVNELWDLPHPTESSKYSSTCPVFSENVSLLLRGASKSVSQVGQACSRNGHCGPREVCDKADVTPPCLEGKCQCQPCHAVGPDVYCVPVKIMRLDQVCRNLTGVEIYPKYSECYKNKVTCKRYFRPQGGICVADAARYAMPGDECTSTRDCFGSLVCSVSLVTSASMNKQPRQCGCKVRDNQKYNVFAGRCVGPLLGDYCVNDAECTSHALLPKEALPRVCRDRQCACQEDHIIHNGHCYAENDVENCPRCPGDNILTPCRVAYIIDDSDDKEEEFCVDQLSVSITTTEQKQEPPQCELDDAIADIKQENRIGQPCKIDQECGLGEICRKDDFIPTCDFGKCACQSCYGLGPNDTCIPMNLMVVGAMCFNTPNELYQQSLEDIEKERQPMLCEKGIAKCHPCYQYDAMSNMCQLKMAATKIEGEHCKDSCECLGEGDMICSPDGNICKCQSSSQIYDEELGRCKPRELWTPCFTGDNCNNSGFTIDGGLCADGFCACRQNYQPTRTGEYIESEGILKHKHICVVSSAKRHLNKGLGSSCIPDPLTHGSSLSKLKGGVCDEGLACISCNLPYNENSGNPSTSARGICRRFSRDRQLPTWLTRKQCTIELIKNSTRNGRLIRPMPYGFETLYVIRKLVNDEISRASRSFDLFTWTIYLLSFGYWMHSFIMNFD